ncbi:MAG: 50S ribosomal protein L10 [Victivallaceae bacterium]|nr:50S ribosomal protein L10 [Victivallaceae bacterium]
MRNEKQFLVRQIGQMISESDYVYFVSYDGLKVADFSALRNQLAELNAHCHVVKNSLISKAAAELKLEGFEQLDFTLGTAMVYGKGDCSAVAKVLVTFGKKNDKVASKGGYMDGAILAKSDVVGLAELPSKQVLQAMLLGVLQAPSRNLVSVLNAKAASILNVLNAYKDKVEKQ